MAGVKLRKISKLFGAQTAVAPMDLDVADGEFLVLVGPSGCGKTTLLNLIGGLDQYTSGDLVIEKKSTKRFDDRDWDDFSR